MAIAIAAIHPGTAAAALATDSFDPVTGALTVNITEADQDNDVEISAAAGEGVEACDACDPHLGVTSVHVTTAKSLDVNLLYMDALAAQGNIPVRCRRSMEHDSRA
jgi:hypothetical protein